MKVQVEKGVIDALQVLKLDHLRFEDDGRLLVAHAKGPNSWGERYAALNGLPVKDLALILAGHYEVIDPVEEAMKENPVLLNVQNLLKKQTAKGVEKYGTSVQPESLSITEWIDHASEEATDLLVYLQALKLQIDKAVEESKKDYPALEMTLESIRKDTEKSLKHNLISAEVYEARIELTEYIAKIYDVALDEHVF